MPVFRSTSVFEVAKGVKAFLSLETGLTRGRVPKLGDPERLQVQLKQTQGQLEHTRQRLRKRLREKDRRLAQLERRSNTAKGSGINPENIVWIFGTARTGSTWLGSMLSEIEGHALWDEPRVGELFGVFLTERENYLRENNKEFILTKNPHQSAWLESVRSLVLEGAKARFPEAEHVTIKEPNGSTGAPFLMEVMPESRMILLVRDPRDIVASILDGVKEGGWLTKAKDLGGHWKQDAGGLDAYAERRSNAILRDISSAKRAYETHKGYKTLVRYEDLSADTLGVMQRVCSSLGLVVDGAHLARAVEKFSWESIPAESKGVGKRHRKATPGGWKEDLTSEQIELVERITAPLLEEFYES